MVLHARPHLETHSRGAGHSAIAGVAYRLGLRLYDRRTGQWHDYRRRKIGEEIVRALTVAPDGAPTWATDPEELWNRAEAAEKRRDAQVARDYRIPIPFGLSDQQAGDLAEQMARFICRELHTAVSLGLHRDADVDALGEAKPAEKVGFHAHLYFPTRRLEEIEGEDGTSDWGLGAKMVLLSNKNTSGAFVERLNERWAELANRYTAQQGLPADYDHRSYVRQELPIIPQPTLGAAVTAMERRGFFTRRGDALRGDILVPSLVYEAAHGVVLEEQQRRAQADVAREAGSGGGKIPEQDPSPTLAITQALRPTPPEGARNETPAVVSVTQEPTQVAPHSSVAEQPWPPFPEGAPGSLLMRFRAAAPVPQTLETHHVLIRVLRLVQVIERVLGALSKLADLFRIHEESRGRRMAAKLDAEIQLREARTRRATARQQLEQWEAAHPLKMWAARAAGSENGKPAEWRALHQEANTLDRRVQEIKGACRRHQTQLDTFDQDAHALKQQESEGKGQLRQALERVQALSQVLADKLMAVTEGEERVWMEVVRPEPVLSTVASVEDVPPPRLRLTTRTRGIPHV